MHALIKQLITESVLKTTIRFPSQLDLNPKLMRLSIEQFCRVFPRHRDTQVRSLQIAGLQAEEIRNAEEATQMIIYIHGGAFFLGSLATHRAYLTQLSARSQMQILHIDYPLAPEQPFPNALNQLFEFYQSLLSQGVLAKDIVLAGDSAGANLALALALKIKQSKLDQVNSLVLISPFVDLTLSSPSLRFNQTHDALLSLDLLKTGISHYLKYAQQAEDSAVSPLFADLTDLPPLLIQVGSKEILLDDAKRLHEKAQQSGVKTTLKIYTGMWHNFHLFYAWFDEAKQSMADFSDFVHHHDQD